MLRRSSQVRVKVHQLLDGVLFGVGFWLAHFVRGHWSVSIGHVFYYKPESITPFFPDYFSLFWVVIILSMLILEGQGFYQQPIFAPRREKAWQLAKACLITTLGLMLFIFMLKGAHARGAILLSGFFSFGLIFAKEELVRGSSGFAFGNGESAKSIVLVGEAVETKALRLDMQRIQPDLKVVGEIDLNQTSTNQLVTFLHEHSVNGVILGARHTLFGRIEEAIQACELEGIEAWLVADFFQTRISQTTIDDFCGRPMLVFKSGPQMSSWPGLIKQMIDMVGAVILLLLTSWIFLGAALLVKLTSRGPVFFQQKRAGLNGKPFVMYKFRTMVTNAEQLQQELASLNEMSGPVFKVTNDPRVTRVGRFLRNKSIDELPQLINVLQGHMSLVGPRPLPVDEVNRFDDMSHRRRLSVKPGLTCLWQVGGRNEVRDFKEWVRLDLEYIDHWSLWLDLKILWLTVPVVLMGKGAK